MKAQVRKIIRTFESERNIRILYACESGSRAWGFASPDSDYDIRFIYAHPKDWYLRLDEKKDFIDTFLPGDLDLSGWDLAKTLRLFSTCNLSLNEWLDSPEVYYEAEGFKAELAIHIPELFNPRKAMHHYLNMAKKVYEKNNDKGWIGIKKLFYVVRPLFCCAWIEREGSMPPTEFQSMLEVGLASNDIVNQIVEIRSQKETAVEGHVIEMQTQLQKWITTQFVHLGQSIESLEGSPEKNWEALNQVMLKWAI